MPSTLERPAGVPAITGLVYQPGFVTAAQAQICLHNLDRTPWSSEIGRRVQHYGWRYDYRARAVRPEMYLGLLPAWMQSLGRKLVAAGHLPHLPDQVIVNEYLPGQGIADHVDCPPCFADHIASLSLGSGVTMQFRPVGSREYQPLWLAPESLLVLSGPARYEWTHGIAKRITDTVAGTVVPRGRRVSLTLRRVQLAGKNED